MWDLSAQLPAMHFVALKPKGSGWEQREISAPCEESRAAGSAGLPSPGSAVSQALKLAKDADLQGQAWPRPLHPPETAKPSREGFLVLLRVDRSGSVCVGTDWDLGGLDLGGARKALIPSHMLQADRVGVKQEQHMGKSSLSPGNRQRPRPRARALLRMLPAIV